jgi:hypothetical protein
VCDVDAPVGTDARGDDNERLPNGTAWARLAQAGARFWLTQTCTFERRDAITDGKTNFQNWVDLWNPAIRGSYADRFQNGYAGWPTTIQPCPAEYLAYWTFWKEGGSKEIARQWGDAAVKAGARCYLDGGSVPVGSGPVPWQP